MAVSFINKVKKEASAAGIKNNTKKSLKWFREPTKIHNRHQ